MCVDATLASQRNQFLSLSLKFKAEYQPLVVEAVAAVVVVLSEACDLTGIFLRFEGSRGVGGEEDAPQPIN